MNRNIAMIGFGEAAMAFVSGWTPSDPTRIAAFDIQTDTPDLAQAMQARQRRLACEVRLRSPMPLPTPI